MATNLACSMLLLGLTSPASAGIYLEFPNGRTLYFPEPLLPLFLLLLAVGIVWLAIASSQSDSSGGDEHSAEDYEQEAARLRAYTRLLEAERELDESRVRSARIKGELAELEEVQNHQRSKHRLWGRR